jgi:hypothetical protein
MSTFAATYGSLTIARVIPDIHLPAVVSTPRGTIRKPKLGLLLCVALASLATAAAALAWSHRASDVDAARQPQQWRYTLTVEDKAPQSFGPFADVTSCNLSLEGTTADLDARLPGLFVAAPCAPSRS